MSGITTPALALFKALGNVAPFIAPKWSTTPHIAILSVGSAIVMAGGAATGLPTPTITYAVTVNGVPKAWPYTVQVADAGATVVVTPTATSLGNPVVGTPVSGVVPAYSPLYPAMMIGQNTPTDSSYSSLRVFNDRVLATAFWTDISATTALPLASQDPTTGLPTTSFAFKLAQGALAADASVTGTWVVNYSNSAQRGVTISSGPGISLISHTFSNGQGAVQIGYTQNASALIVAFDGPVTALSAYDPTTYSTWSTGGTPSLFSNQLLGTIPEYAYLRQMDLSQVNQDYVSGNTWPDSVEWADRRTPSSVYLDLGAGPKGGMPLEWQVQLCNATGKPGWFCIPELASDDYITKHATYVAQNLSSSLIAMFEQANERWNTSGGFWNYRKAGYAGMTEAVAFQASATTEWIRTYAGGCHISTFASDGTTATIVFTGGTGHGLTVGTSTYAPKIVGNQTGYNNFGATGPMTVIDAFTVTYPTSQASTGGTLSAATVLQASGFLALNGQAGIFTGANFGSIYDFSRWWHYRRAYQMAKLVKDAFVAAGRPASDCQPVLALQAGAGDSAQYSFGSKGIINFISAQFAGGRLKDRFKAVAVGGYLQLDQGSGIVNTGFGLSANTRKTPQDSASVLSQLKAMADVAYGCYSYGTTAAWVSAEGMELWGYEVGLDTVGINDQSTTTQNACTAANGDPGMQAIITEWAQAFVAMGFKRFGWYQCGAGTYANYGCFNLGQSASEITASTPSANQSPKYKGLMAALSAWATPQPRHVVPCALSGYDVVGNEPVTTSVGLWPSLSGANISGATYPGPSANGQTYYVWLEAQYPQTSVVTIKGDYTTSAAITISVQPLTPDGSGGGAFPLAGVQSAATLGSCNITLQPGPNYVFVSASANQANVFPHEVDFA